MDCPRLLSSALRPMQRRRRCRESGYLLIEVCIAVSLLLAAGFFTLRTNRAAISNSVFAMTTMLVDNYIENQAAAVKAAAVNSDGSLVLPSFAAASVYDQTPTTLPNQALAPGSQFRADITTYRRPAGSQSNVTFWEYVVEVRFARKLSLNGTSGTPYLKSRSVVRPLPQ